MGGGVSDESGEGSNKSLREMLSSVSTELQSLKTQTQQAHMLIKNAKAEIKKKEGKGKQLRKKLKKN